MRQGIGLIVGVIGVVLLWGAVTGNSVRDEFLAGIGIGGNDRTGSPSTPDDPIEDTRPREPVSGEPIDIPHFGISPVPGRFFP